MNHLVNIDLLLSEERNISSHLSRVFLHTLKNSFLVHLYLKTDLKTELNAQRWGVEWKSLLSWFPCSPFINFFYFYARTARGNVLILHVSHNNRLLSVRVTE